MLLSPRKPSSSSSSPVLVLVDALVVLLAPGVLPLPGRVDPSSNSPSTLGFATSTRRQDQVYRAVPASKVSRQGLHSTSTPHCPEVLDLQPGPGPGQGPVRNTYLDLSTPTPHSPHSKAPLSRLRHRHKGLLAPPSLPDYDRGSPAVTCAAAPRSTSLPKSPPYLVAACSLHHPSLDALVVVPASSGHPLLPYLTPNSSSPGRLCLTRPSRTLHDMGPAQVFIIRPSSVDIQIRLPGLFGSLQL